MPRPVPANSAPSLPILQKAPLPTEQLAQIQRRLGHLLNSLAELQGHVANAQTLEEWPALLSRHLALASQTSSLTTFLSHANTNYFNTQISQFNEALTNEALYNNKFASTSSDVTNGTQGASSIKDDALFSGTKSDTAVKESIGTLLKVQYYDENNPLRKIAPHPFFQMESEKSQMILPALLLPKADDSVIHEHEEQWKSWARGNGVSENRGAIKDHLAALETVRGQIVKHDDISGQAMRSFIHAKEATDELGQRYDWKIRLDPNEVSEDEEDAGAMEEDQDSQEMNERKRKREEEVKTEETLTLEQVSRLLTTGQM